jgi:nucleoside-diphosphate-sugar epimerase
VDLVHITNCVEAHLLAASNLLSSGTAHRRAFFITNGEPLPLWTFVQQLLAHHGLPPVKRHMPLGLAYAIGWLCERAWALGSLQGEPPMTRFVAKELATDHWFSITAASEVLGYQPKLRMSEGLAQLPAFG